MRATDITDQVRGFTATEVSFAKEEAERHRAALREAGYNTGDYIVVQLGNAINLDTRQLRVFPDGRVELHKP